MATLGDIIYRAASAWDKVTGNTSATKKFLTQTGDGSASAEPAWGTISAGDLPTIAETKGGTNQTGYTTGDVLYASASNTLSKLAGNTAATKKFLNQTGTGSASAAPEWDALAAADLPDDNRLRTLAIVINGGGAAIATGIVPGDLLVPYGGTIVSATLLADQSGSLVVDIWRDSYANYPPTDADSITASAPPTLSSAVKAQDSTLTGWTKTITAGDTLRFNVDSVTTCTYATLILVVRV